MKHPELVGGDGVYSGNSSHGPFAHIDVRGASRPLGPGGPANDARPRREARHEDRSRARERIRGDHRVGIWRRGVLQPASRADRAIRGDRRRRDRGRRVAERIRREPRSSPALRAARAARRVSARGQRRSVVAHVRVDRDARLDRRRARRSRSTARRSSAPRRPGFYRLAIVRGTIATDHSRADARRDGAVRAARSAAC